MSCNIREKIEGFFEVCQQLGLTGKQGVLIPAANTTNLMLNEQVLEAVEKNQFNIWAINSIEQGIEILTGIKAGKTFWDKSKNELSFEKDSVYFKVNERLNQMVDIFQNIQF